MTFRDLIAPLSPALPDSEENPVITGVTPDPTLCRPGSLFVAIAGFHRDGHESLGLALAAGAAACVIRADRPDCAALLRAAAVPFLAVPDTRAAEAVVTSRFYGDPWRKLSLTAVTGTNGKTTLVSLLQAVYSMAGYACTSIGTLTGRLTTPDPAQLYPKLKELAESGASHVFMEASSHALALGKLTPIRFHTAIFTNLTPEHLDFHQTMDRYADAKATLFRQADRSIVNLDDPYAERMIRCAAGQVVTCSAAGRTADFRAFRIVKNGAGGLSYDLSVADRIFRIRVPLPGDFTVMNTLEAAAAALADGIPQDVIRGTLAGFRGVKGRLERLPLPTNDYAVYLDFAHTPDALENILRTVRDFMMPGQRLVLLFGCGGDRDRSKRPLMGGIASRLADFVIVTSDNCRSENAADIISEILSGFDGPAPYLVIENRREAIEYAVSSAISGDILLLCGKGHEEYEIRNDGIHPFSERDIVLRATESRLRGKGEY